MRILFNVILLIRLLFFLAASCTIGDVVLQDGESRLIGCFKYICKDSTVDKRDYTSFLCGVVDDVCCKEHSQKAVLKKVLKRGCLCSTWVCEDTGEQSW